MVRAVAALVLGGAAAASAVGCGGKDTRTDNRFVFDDRLGSYHYLASLREGRSYPAAIAAFGRPSSRGTTRDSNLCTVRWAEIGLDIGFASNLAPCAAGSLRRGAWFGMVLHSRRWLVDKGLRVGDKEAKLRKLYPRSRLIDQPPGPPAYWLRTGIGESNTTTPLLTAELWDGRVVSITVEAGYIY